ncbi:relaxase/mobilization nuclease domain-containing protein [Sphingobacterium cellulitidis]|uniref:MobA/VirD2-like nuclease domain-containing protein n=2 Tax=Sphingobacterium cellulitidis TaxID=1768011 RepID=A0A8H9FZG7_9SPHI|nr:relaxase/mobilization nuclease domain-containing protein [Sphingobacterium soli]GGE24191.1 hypothetical protein GCM10011516_22270 [Sphingobacterium soli]
MVALTYDVASVSRIIAYHEKKVASGIAECLMAGNMPLSSKDLSIQQKTSYMVNRCTLNANIKLPCLHSILGFHPLDGRLSNSQFRLIAECYMELIGFGLQPFLVYRHSDTYHPHMHIVSTNIRSDGSQIYTHRLGQRLSIPAAKKLEADFDLVPAQENLLGENERPTPIRELIQAAQPLNKSLRDILLYLQRTYSFSDLQEWNALLKPFNILALRPKAHTNDQKKGLIYYLTDKSYRTVSKGIPQANLSPDLGQFPLSFFHVAQREKTSITRLRTVIQQKKMSSSNQGWDAKQLLFQGIELIQLPGKGKASSETVVIDHMLYCAIHERKLGLGFDINSFKLGHSAECKMGKDLQIAEYRTIKL